jgi:hypothetical protein
LLESASSSNSRLGTSWEQHEPRHGLVVVELGDEAFKHLLDAERAVGPRKIRAVAPVLPGAEEEHLDAGLPALLVGSEYVGLLDVFGIDGLVCGDVREGPQAVAILGSLLVVQVLGRLVHEPLVHLAGVLAFAPEKARRLLDQRTILIEADLAGAGGRAALDLVEQARPGAALEHGIGARAEQERPLQHVDSAVDGAGRGERPEVVALAVARTPMLEDLRRLVVTGDQDVGERLVVPQQHVVARAEPLDQVGLEQQGLGFGAHGHEFHRRGGGDHARDAVGVVAGPRVAGDARLQVARLADVDHIACRIDHAVDAGGGLQRLEVLRDGGWPHLGGLAVLAAPRVGAERHLTGVLEWHNWFLF